MSLYIHIHYIHLCQCFGYMLDLRDSGTHEVFNRLRLKRWKYVKNQNDMYNGQLYIILPQLPFFNGCYDWPDVIWYGFDCVVFFLFLSNLHIDMHLTNI